MSREMKIHKLLHQYIAHDNYGCPERKFWQLIISNALISGLYYETSHKEAPG